MTTPPLCTSWALVLAGGNGERLAPLTTALYGFPLPKQYAVFSGTRSLLQATLDRVSILVPDERLVVVAAAQHERHAREQLRARPGVTLLLQPRNLDTGPGVLFGLAHILARDPTATIAVFPSDHHIPHPEPVLQAVRELLARAGRADWDLALVGAEADRPETDYGWIVPGPPADASLPGLFRITRFVEKPCLKEAHSLLETRSLWNTFIFVGRGDRMWSLGRTHLRAVTDRLRPVRRSGEPNGLPTSRELEDAYATIPRANWSRDVLARGGSFTVWPAMGSGWSDWGSPDRVVVGDLPRSAA
jgi:mannose-1-phosphate guanylyltransferase